MKLRNQGTTWREIDGETVILDLKSSTYLTVNRTGTFLLKELVEERSEADLISALVEEFEISPELATKDVEAFAQTLDAQGLLDTVPDGTRVHGMRR